MEASTGSNRGYYSLVMEESTGSNPPPLQLPSSMYLGNTEQYFNVCVPLTKYALRGDWETTKSLLDANGGLVSISITKDHSTILHLAAGADHFKFVRSLVDSIGEEDLELQNSEGNTALYIAAGVGNVEIVEILLSKRESLATIRNRVGLTPLHFAAMQGSQMASYLFSRIISALDNDDKTQLFFICIQNDIHGIALELLHEMEGLALARDESHETGLHILAKNNSSFSGTKKTTALELVDLLWINTQTSLNSRIQIAETVIGPLFSAAEVGNFEFLAVILSYYPDLIWEVDKRNRTIIHIAVLYRHAEIFNIIHDLGAMKDVLLTFNDTVDVNNILHMAAKVTPSNDSKLAMDAALEMTRELIWFEEVKKITLLSHVEKRNQRGLTPQQC